MSGQELRVVIRFEAEDAASFRASAEPVVAYWRGREGCLEVELVRNLDDPGLWAILSRWRDVGSYRRSFSGFEAKLILTPLLGRAVDEPTAYLAPDEVPDPVWRGEVEE
ncbi:MAG: antibiotic biosynthesis monooxygenase family protein [Propionibacteriaceae bacterium]|nr:antibiotic biosynthesis monooxygenase family protein [Propionibacteriaceae bacterium]